MRHREHPTPDLLLRFLAGDTSRTERRAIVRHLLTGCPECLAVTRPAWRLPDPWTVAREEMELEESELNAV